MSALKRLLLTALVALLALGALPTRAQTEPSALLDMLSRLPDTPQNRAWISYVDFRALLASRPGAAQPASLAEWRTLQASDSKAFRLALAALQGIYAGPEQLSRYRLEPEPIFASTGIDLFTVQWAVEAGRRPGPNLILKGDFDPAAIISAFTARGFEENTLDGLTVMCGAAGCAEGLRTNPQEGDRYNFFGGYLGRKEPLVVTADYLYNSPVFANVQAIVQTARGQSPSLADAPEFRALANALAGYGTLIHLLIPDVNQVVRQPPQNAPEATKTPFPAYTLIGFAHTFAAEAQHVLIPMVYDAQAEAEQAAAILPGRLQTYRSLPFRRDFAALIAERGGSAQPPVVFKDADTGKTVLLLVIQAPLDGEEPGLVPGSLRVSGLLFRFFVQALMQYDLGWLAAEFWQ